MDNNYNITDLSHTMWYKTPTEDWNTAMPVGNGRIGGMVFGQPVCEKICLNEDSVWSGGYRKRNNQSALPNLEKVRRLIKEENIEAAEKIVMDAFCGAPVNQRHYMPLADLSIAHMDVSSAEYEMRGLDLSTAVAFTKYKIGSANITREVICSAPSQVLAVNIKSDEKAFLNLRIGIDGRDDYFDDNSPLNDTDILFYGGCGSEDGIRFAAYIRVIPKGGKAYRYGSFIQTECCDEVTIILGVQTDYRYRYYKEQAKSDVEAAAKLSYEELKALHIADYKSLFDRADLSIEDDSAPHLPTDERLKLLKEGGKDGKLVEMYFHFGRYLMISASREGTLPMNLQGIWNKDMWPAWGCRFTVNINTEMNYWAVEVCNLPELHMPLFDHIERMRPNGRVTAREMYGCGGFVCHHNTDIWGDTAPQDLWMPGTQWPMGAAWLCTHIWQHYLFTQDKEFLAEKFDTLKESAEFFKDFLIEDNEGRLVTCPSVSPENTYLTETGAKGSICMGPSMDSQIIRELFTAVIESGRILGKDEEFCAQLEKLRERLPEPEVGKYGQIKEWAVDYDEVEPGHRHISQLFALYPSDMISMRKTPELAKAARATLERRLSHGGGHTGWSRAWIINHWARLFDGEKVEENIHALLANSTSDNLFDMHPPFQIDGNFGGTAGIAEALLQSVNGEIIPLPALPPSWKKGFIRNLCARGGFTVDMSWEDSRVAQMEIRSLAGEKCRLVCTSETRIYCGGEPVEFIFENSAAEFETEKGKSYTVVF